MSVNPFANAQVCCGGVDANEVDGTTMESKICPGLYLAGRSWMWMVSAVATIFSLPGPAA